MSFSLPMLRRPSGRPFVVTPSNIFSNASWSIKAKFHVEPSWEGGTKVYKKLLQQDISNPELYGGLVYKFKKII